MSKVIGDVILDVQNISLRFGGVKALTDISFNVKEHEIRSIIGPNGAGKSSMLNCINGVYTPSEGSITFRGQTFDHMNSRQVAEMGIARTFQNLALFKGMSVIDNIMTGRNLRIKSNIFMQALRIGPAQRHVIHAVSQAGARPSLRKASCPVNRDHIARHHCAQTKGQPAHRRRTVIHLGDIARVDGQRGCTDRAAAGVSDVAVEVVAGLAEVAAHHLVTARHQVVAGAVTGIGSAQGEGDGTTAAIGKSERVAALLALG